MKHICFSVIVLLLAPQAALAADPPATGSDPAAAQTLFYEGRALMQQGKYAAACPKLEESLRLDLGVGTQFNLADCNEHLGKIATAWVSFLEVASEAKQANQSEREKIARKRAQALEPRLPKLVIEVPTATQGMEIKRDGVVVGTAAWGTPIPVDPGPHLITVTAPDKQWESTVTSVEGKTARINVPRDLPAAVTVPTSPQGTATTTAAPVPPVSTFPSPVVEHGGSPQRTIGWVLTGVGAVGLGVGAGFGLSSLGKRDESRSHCAGATCDADGVALRDDAIRNGNIATIATIAGGAVLVTGLIVVLSAPKATEKQVGFRLLRALPNVATSGGGFALQGTFQ